MAEAIDNKDINIEIEKTTDYRDKPLQLINFKGDGFELNEEALNIISSIVFNSHAYRLIQ